MKKIIVSGADGFIGSNLIKYVLERDIEVWAIVHPRSKTKDKIPKIEQVHCIECELLQLEQYLDFFPKDVDVFYHLAWQGVNANDRNNMELQMNNIEYTMECLRIASVIGVNKFLLPGSTSEYLYYGKSINETAIPSPQNAYGSVKVALRYLASQYAKELKVEFIYTVITGIYASDRKDNNVIFYTIEKLLKKERPSLTKLEQMWNYIHIRDVSNALFLIGESGRNGAFYGIGDELNRPLFEYINIIHQNIDSDLPIGIGDIPYKDEKMPSSCIDLTQLQKDTGFFPKITFEEGITEVINSMKGENT